MAVFTVENTSKVGNYVTVFDALGVEVKKCTYCDDETGEIERFATDEKGRCICDRMSGGIVRIREMRPLPLRVEPI